MLVPGMSMAMKREHAECQTRAHWKLLEFR